MSTAGTLEEATTQAIKIEREFEWQNFNEKNGSNSHRYNKNTQINVVESEKNELCQICRKSGHSALKCWYRGNGDTQATPQAPRREALLTTPNAERTMPRQATGRGQLPPAPWNRRESENRYAKQTYSPNTASTSQANVTNDICNYCKKPGHWKNQCRLREQSNQYRQTQNQGNQQIFPQNGALREEQQY